MRKKPTCLRLIVTKEEENISECMSDCHKRRGKMSTCLCLIVTKEEGKSLSMPNCHKRRRKMPSCLCQIVPKEEENVYLSTSNCHKRRRKMSPCLCLIVPKNKKKKVLPVYIYFLKKNNICPPKKISSFLRLIVKKEEKNVFLSLSDCPKRRRKSLLVYV